MIAPADVAAIAIAAAMMLAMCVACWPRRRSPARELELDRELSLIRSDFSGRGKLLHLGRPDVLAILISRSNTERRDVDLFARALRIQKCFDAAAASSATSPPIGRISRRRSRRGRGTPRQQPPEVLGERSSPPMMPKVDGRSAFGPAVADWVRRAIAAIEVRGLRLWL